MSKRVRHPLVSFAMFLVVVAAGVVVWQHRDEFKGQPQEVVLERAVREALENDILDSLQDDGCFDGMRGHVNWRPNEGRYRLDLEIADGASCERRARALCEHVARMIQERTDRPATVIAYDRAGRELGRCVL
jgi:hypothetical protein